VLERSKDDHQVRPLFVSRRLGSARPTHLSLASPARRPFAQHDAGHRAHE